MKRIGFLINPIAGMGGRVGLKGTDGVADAARALGANPLAPRRADAALTQLRRLLTRSEGTPPVRWLTCSGEMGEAALLAAGFSPADIETVYRVSGESGPDDTQGAVTRFLEQGVDLIVFCGGDGTARDICAVTGLATPVLGIPAGVKMYSGVFGTNPKRTAEILFAFLHDQLNISEVEVLDLDETRYRAGEWNVRLYYAALTPFEPSYTQSSKAVIEEAEDADIKKDIAEFLHEQFAADPERLVLLGPGSTVQSIAERCGIEKTLTGVDAIANGRLVGADLNERQLLELVSRYPSGRLILSPIGAQGFVLGRGNLQLSPEVIRQIGRDGITIVATPAKLARTPVLRFDTGASALDQDLVRDGYVLVVTGYRRRRVVKAAA